MRLPNQISLGFAAGSLGALANVGFLIAAGAGGLIAAMSIQLPEPALPAFLYKQVAWGGLWGILLAVPLLGGNWVVRGLILSLLASAATLFFFFPMLTSGDQGPGMAGLNLGTLTPVLVLVANAVWGLVAAWWYSLAASLSSAVPGINPEGVVQGKD
ncbi:hypothetical protein HBA54_21750 [Pelagibius litoralis]|uniref:Uncharacterized protein n=1 Tax=Pelagibius litoralis TaxID=374515 RepID=A0A967F1C2_9PROT|nr:hypothetical protein [Pelagibius litoralis]NIA71228.1 hypothetical protein [Pelagibius litoralis]